MSVGHRRQLTQFPMCKLEKTEQQKKSRIQMDFWNRKIKLDKVRNSEQGIALNNNVSVLIY